MDDIPTATLYSVKMYGYIKFNNLKYIFEKKFQTDFSFIFTLSFLSSFFPPFLSLPFPFLPSKT